MACRAACPAVSRALRSVCFDEPHDLGQIIAKLLFVRDQPVVRKARGEIAAQLVGVRSDQDRADPDGAARDENFAQGAFAD
jgi:hypothetical protein